MTKGNARPRSGASFWLIGGTCLGLAALLGCGGSAPEPGPEVTQWVIEQSVAPDGSVAGVRIVKLPELEVVGLCGYGVGEWTVYETLTASSASYEAPGCYLEIDAEEVQ